MRQTDTGKLEGRLGCCRVAAVGQTLYNARKQTMTHLLLIHPPVVRPCEPPPGLARIAGAVRRAGGRVRIWDANLEGILHLMGLEAEPGVSPEPRGGDVDDTWTRRARRDGPRHLAEFRSGEAFRHPDTYRRVVGDLNRLVATGISADSGWRVSLTDLESATLSPARSADLNRAAEAPADNPFFPFFAEGLRRRLEAEAPPVIGFSLNYLSQALTVFAMAGFLRQIVPGIRLVVGGALLASWAAAHGVPAVARDWFDLVVTGPGEEPMVGFCQKAGLFPESLAGGMFDPDYSEFPLAQYFSPGLTLPFAAADGCFWSNCAFCPEKAEGGAYRPLPTDTGWELLARQIERHRPRLLHLCESAVSAAWLKKLVQEFPHLTGAPDWYGFARFSPPLDDPGFCRELRRSGCRMLQLGLESGSQRVLDELYKGVELPMAERILANLHAAGIATYVYVLFGTPPEAESEARATMEFVASHHREIGFLNVAIFNLPLGTPEAKSLPVRPFNAGDLPLYLDFEHPRGWDRRAVRRFLDREFRQHPAIGPILRRDPPFFTSNHAPFFRESLFPG